jgi:hypothetical protein
LPAFIEFFGSFVPSFYIYPKGPTQNYLKVKAGGDVSGAI